MLSVKSSLLLSRCLAVVICSLLLVLAKHGRGLPVSADSNAVATFGAASEQNAKLKLELNWTFGAKPQRGWYLYTPLIQRLLNSGAAPETNSFAQALADWQRSAGLASTGVLDQETWLKM